MRYVAAYLLAALGGNEAPSADDLKTILSSVGVGVDDEKLALVMANLAGKDINEVCFNYQIHTLFTSRPVLPLRPPMTDCLGPANILPIVIL